MTVDINDIVSIGKHPFFSGVPLKIFAKYVGENSARHYKEYLKQYDKLPKIRPKPFLQLPQTPPDDVLVLKHKALERKYQVVINQYSELSRMFYDTYKQLKDSCNSINSQIENFDRYLSHHALRQDQVKIFSDDELPYRITMDELKSFLISYLGFESNSLIDYRPIVEQLNIKGHLMSISISACEYTKDLYIASLFFNDGSPLPAGYGHTIEVWDSRDLVEYIQRYKPILSIENKSQF